MGQSFGARVYKCPRDHVEAPLMSEALPYGVPSASGHAGSKRPFGFTAREVRARCEVLFESLWPWGGRRGRDLWPLLCLERIPGQGCVTRPVLYSTGILVQPWTVKQEPQQNISVMDWSIFRVVLKTRIDRVLTLKGLFSRVLGRHWYFWLRSLYKWLHSHPSVFGGCGGRWPEIRHTTAHSHYDLLAQICLVFQYKYLRS